MALAAANRAQTKKATKMPKKAATKPSHRTATPVPE
jgi:hypothetical protein